MDQHIFFYRTIGGFWFLCWVALLVFLLFVQGGTLYCFV